MRSRPGQFVVKPTLNRLLTSHDIDEALFVAEQLGCGANRLSVQLGRYEADQRVRRGRHLADEMPQNGDVVFGEKLAATVGVVERVLH